MDVIYVAPRPLDQEVLDYYHKLLAMVGVAEGAESQKRIHVVTPENAGGFPHHNLSLATELLYSPHALTRIRHLTAGRMAYIVPGRVSRDDIAVADILGLCARKTNELDINSIPTVCLDLPLLASEPDVSQLYSSKSGAKKIFLDAGVGVPPSAGDIFSEDQLLESLSHLVAAQPLISRWIFKLQDHISGRGFGEYCWIWKNIRLKNTLCLSN